MMNGTVDIRYELALLGPNCEAHKDALCQRVTELFSSVGLDFAHDGYVLVGGETFPNWGGFPVAVWFAGDKAADATDLALMREFLERGFTLFPVADTLSGFSDVVPPELKAINGQVWDATKVAADIMKGFRLARALRQVFISYRRNESAGLAHQLFNELNERGFRVFLDTASVEAGINFQKALWSRMADVDLVILLDSPTALDSTWVHQELNRAHDLGLGVVQLVWPGHKQTAGTELSFPIKLTESDFIGGQYGKDGRLEEAVICRVIREIEGERIRSLSARRSRLVDGLLEHVSGRGGTVNVHPMRNIDVLKDDKKIAEVVPFVGVPDALSLYQSEISKSHEPTIVVYNGLGVDEEWAKHLIWINGKGLVSLHQIDDFGSYIGSIV